MATRVTDPGEHHGRPSANRGKTYPVEILTPDEVRGLAAQCSVTSSRGIRHRALIVLLYRTGLRISEALALAVGDVDLDVGSVLVRSGLGGRRRTVGIDRGANPHVAAWIDRRRTLGIPDTAPLLCTLASGPMRKSEVSATLRLLARKAGITKRVHTLRFRHTHAYELNRRCVRPVEMGDSTVGRGGASLLRGTMRVDRLLRLAPRLRAPRRC